ncbi:MAG: AAA family ATPase, partial [Deltaproteobacteria bacterium]|nr:AAA family ATPase [Deltaproteobacteria bacterium]
MIVRQMTQELKDAAREYPVVTVFGSRQSGKTTLVRMTFPEKAYYSLEAPDVRAAAAADPRGFLGQAKTSGMVIDEVQRLPEL